MTFLNLYEIFRIIRKYFQDTVPLLYIFKYNELLIDDKLVKNLTYKFLNERCKYDYCYNKF